MSSDGPVDRRTDRAPVGPRHRLADALRQTITATVSADAPPQDVLAAAVAVEEVNRRLAAAASGRRRTGPPDLEGEVQMFFPTSPIMGVANPLAPPVLVRAVDGPDGTREVVGTAVFDDPYEGPPTCVHGGIIAATFDEILGAVLLANATPAMTGTLTIRYRRPTPLWTELRLVAKPGRKDGRKVYPWAGIYHGDTLTAEAEGIFIVVHPPTFLSLVEGNATTTDPEMLAAIRAAALRVGAASDVHPATEIPPEEAPGE